MRSGKTSISFEKLSPAQTLILLQSCYAKQFQGYLYSGFYKKTFFFQNECEMLSALDSLWDSMEFPQPSFESRSFGIKKMKTVVRKADHLMESEENDLLKQAKATFIVHIHFRQNASWQGEITWVEKDKSCNFRSTLEMLKLMDEARNPGLKETVGWGEEA